MKMFLFDCHRINHNFLYLYRRRDKLMAEKKCLWIRFALKLKHFLLLRISVCFLS